MEFQKCQLYKCTSKKKLLHLLKTDYYTPSELKKIESTIDSEYCFFYIDKKNPKYKTKIPPVVDKSQFRMVCAHTKVEKSPERKGSLKKIQKQFLKLLSKIEKPVYMHSGYKKTSFLTNAEEHKGNNYIVKFDIKDFFPSVGREKVYSFFKNKLEMSTDISKICAILCTAPSKNPHDIENEGASIKYSIGQGLATSNLLSYLVNYELFEELNNLSIMNNCLMTIYVDDITFSSNSEIKQEFIDKVFSLAKRNSINLRRDKVRNYRHTSTKKITGVCLREEKVFVSARKVSDIKRNYAKLYNEIKKANKNNDYLTSDKYSEIYNEWLKFRGNVEFYKYVNGKVPKHWGNLLKKLDGKFPTGLQKRRKSEPYSPKNLRDTSITKFQREYIKFKTKTMLELDMV